MPDTLEIDEAAETITTPADDSAAIDEFQSMLDGAPETEAQDEPTPDAGAATEHEETAGGDDKSAADESGQETEGEAEAEPEVTKAEGPTFLMKQEAARAGLDDRLIATARDDEQLQAWIELVKDSGSEEPEDETDAAKAAAEESLAFELPEEEYGAEDPLRKSLVGFAEKLNGKLKDSQRALSMLAAFANDELKRREAGAAKALYEPFDESLDSYEVDVLGNRTKGLSATQQQARTAIAKRYVDLGATPETPDDEKARLAELAVAAYRKDLQGHKQKQKTAAKRQAKQVIGGGGSARNVEQAPTEDDLIEEFQKRLDGKAPWDAE